MAGTVLQPMIYTDREQWERERWGLINYAPPALGTLPRAVRKIFGRVEQPTVFAEMQKWFSVEQMEDYEPIVALPNGRIVVLSVQVDESRKWSEAVRAAGPNTGKGWDIWNVGDHYPAAPTSTRRLTQVILVNWKDGVPNGTVPLEWGKKQRLAPATPRSVFAIGEQYPDLNRLMGVNYMSLVSLRECAFNAAPHVPGVWWDEAGRHADLGWLMDGWNGDDWFAFVRE